MKTWFIAGASSGVERLLTEQLLARGDRVAATLRRTEALDDLRASGGDRLWVAGLDITETAQVHRVVSDAFAALGTIDVVVTNAGYGVSTSAEEATDEQGHRVIDTNLLGSVHVIRAALPHFRAQGHGRILQFSTAGGRTTHPESSYYHASKWRIEDFCETVAREIATFDIGPTIVEPGATRTRLDSSLDSAPAMPEREGSPADDVRGELSAGAHAMPSDPAKVTQAMIDLVEAGTVPLHLPLVPDTYDHVRASLAARLAEHDAHRDVALSAMRNEPQ